MILYISEKRLNLIDNVSNKYGLPIFKTKANNLDNFKNTSGKSLDHANCFVIDLIGLNDTNDEIIKSINQIIQLYDNLRIVILADTYEIYKNNKDLLRRIYELGIYSIITKISDEEIEKCILIGKSKEDVLIFSVEKVITSEKLTEDIEESKEQFEEKEKIEHKKISKSFVITEEKNPIVEKLQANKSFREFKKFINIGIVGVEPHIGTTHNAILITRFLKNIGFKTCYLETTNILKIFNIKNNKKSIFNDNKNHLQYLGTNLYWNYKLNQVMEENYDFYIFDLGVLNEKILPSFLMRDIKILVSGSKEWETPNLQNSLDMIGKNNINIFMNFNDGIDKISLEHRFLTENRNIYFSEYTKSSFSDNVNVDVYKRIFKNYIL
ncbi:MAG: hypothetical protein FWF57_05105 [Defluviitaleaceae bacterium]|nr:hypothetical protein [Defluviitaleaceae bacterium]